MVGISSSTIHTSISGPFSHAIPPYAFNLRFPHTFDLRFPFTLSTSDSLPLRTIPTIFDPTLPPPYSIPSLVVSVVAIAVTEVLAYTSPPPRFYTLDSIPSILYPRFYTLDSIPSDLRRPRASL